MASEWCDVIVTHSPPLFPGHNAKPELSVLYQNWLVISQQQQSPLAVRRYNARSSNSPTREDKQPVPQVKVRRPCLVIRADSEGSIGSWSSSSSSDENEPSSPTRRKKKVVFADDRGLSLTQVRMMNEPSNQPPKLMAVGSYLQQNGGGGAADGAAEQAQWRLQFPQPASSYLDFRRRLDVDNVSLENVIVKSSDRRIVGTVKVRNLSYDKDVFVRCTRDRWATHLDTACAYVQNNASSSDPPPGCNVAAIYDTFSFRVPLPDDVTHMEFAVCYKSPEFECWDNNDGRNYGLCVEQPAAAGPQQQQQQQQQPPPPPSLLMSSVGPDEFADHPPVNPVHYFGALSSRHNAWGGATRDHHQIKDAAVYW